MTADSRRYDRRMARTAEDRQRVVQMYLDGVPVHQISDETGVPRPTIYYYVRQSGSSPDRGAQRRSKPTDHDELHSALQYAMIQVTELAGQNAVLRARVAELEAQLGIEPQQEGGHMSP